MNIYTVYQFGVDKNYNEFNRKIWTGRAESEEEAKDFASMQWEKEKRDFMKGYFTVR